MRMSFALLEGPWDSAFCGNCQSSARPIDVRARLQVPRVHPRSNEEPRRSRNQLFRGAAIALTFVDDFTEKSVRYERGPRRVFDQPAESRIVRALELSH